MGEAVAEVGSTANSYQILARLAAGGMAEIFLARGVSATGVERYCVLKRILRHRAGDAAFVRMFLDEARLAAHLQHPNVAQVYDIGKLGDSYFFTMEYVHGETVRAIMQRTRSLRRDLPLGSILTIIAGAAAGLHHAHERIGVDGKPLHIVHRDVSPSNLMVSYEGNIKVVDFGVAKAADRATETRSGTVKGKISYLSPEQARGSSAIDRRSDLFSLGIVMWEMLTLERLYKRASDFANMSAIVNEPTPPPSSRKSWIPPALDAIALKLLAKSPDERFQTGDELVQALEELAARNATMISSSALARVLRDMFGQRPEPWVELDTIEVPDGVTVTSEPIPDQLAVPIDANVDLRLASVPKLELAPPSDEDVLASRPDEVPTRTLTLVTPAEPVEAVADAPRGGAIVVDGGAVPAKGGRWQLVAVVTVAAILGSLTMWLAMRRGGTDAPVDAAVVIAAPAIDAGEPAVAIDAAEPAPPIDADVEVDAAVEPPPPPSARGASSVTIDAAWDAGNYREVVTRCTKRPDDARCVIAACKARNEGKARAFLAKLDKTKRRGAITACKSAGVDLVDSRPEPKDDKTQCELDPMSCQH